MTVDFYAAVQGDKYIEPVNGDWERTVNVSNDSATRLLGLIGVSTEELVGTLSFAQVRQMADKVDDLALVEPPFEYQGGSGAKVIYCGMSLDRLRGYQARLLDLVDYAEREEAQFISYA